MVLIKTALNIPPSSPLLLYLTVEILIANKISSTFLNCFHYYCHWILRVMGNAPVNTRLFVLPHFKHITHMHTVDRFTSEIQQYISVSIRSIICIYNFFFSQGDLWFIVAMLQPEVPYFSILMPLFRAWQPSEHLKHKLYLRRSLITIR